MKKNNIKLSVIIPVFNTERFIKKALDSLFNQTLDSLEVIIVNNGSSGDINDIVADYQRQYPSRRLKLIVHEKNLGTFHGRGSGMSVAEGEFFTFMDADDRVGPDFYYQMIKQGEDVGADIVMADLVHEDENGKQFRYIVDPVLYSNFNEDSFMWFSSPFDQYFGLRGLSYSMYGIWNKIYRRSLWDKCLPYINKIDEHFALCEDAAYTTIFFSQAEKITNIHNQYYYHYVHSDSASANLLQNEEKARRNAKNQGIAFRNIKSHLERIGIYSKYEQSFKQFKNFHLRIMLFELDRSNFSASKKRDLAKYFCEMFEESSPGQLTVEEMVFTSNLHYQDSTYEKIEQDIVNVEKVYFDLRDVIFWDADFDNSAFFSEFQSQIDKILKTKIPAYRLWQVADVMAEVKFGKNKSIQTLVDSISEICHLSDEQNNELLSAVLNIKRKSIFPRQFVRHFLDLSKRCSKQIIFLSDGYYSIEWWNDVIRSFDLDNYSTIIEDITDLKEKFNPIGQVALLSQFNMINCVENGCSFYVVRAPEETLNQTPFGNFLNNNLGGWLFKQKIRTLWVSKFFDNPFVAREDHSSYNANPYMMGYIAGGALFAEYFQQLRTLKSTENPTRLVLGEDLHFLESEIKDLFPNARIEKFYGNPSTLNSFELRVFALKHDISNLSALDILELFFTEDTVKTLAKELGDFRLAQGFRNDIEYLAFCDKLFSFDLVYKPSVNYQEYKDATFLSVGISPTLEFEKTVVGLKESQNLACSSRADIWTSRERILMSYLLSSLCTKNTMPGGRYMRWAFQKGIKDFLKDSEKLVNCNGFKGLGLVLIKDILNGANWLDRLIFSGDRVDGCGKNTNIMELARCVPTLPLNERQILARDECLGLTFKGLVFSILFDRQYLKRYMANKYGVDSCFYKTSRTIYRSLKKIINFK